MNSDYPSPSYAQGALTNTAGSTQGTQHDPRQGTRSGPSQRKRMPKRFDFIPEDRQKELFPVYGERVVDYKRQMTSKSNNKRQSRKGRTKGLRQAEAAHEPMPVGAITSISEPQQPKLWEGRNVATDSVDRSNFAESVFNFSISQGIGCETHRFSQGHGHNPSTSCSQSALGPREPLPTSVPYSPIPHTMSSYQAAESVTPYSHQHPYNIQLPHSDPGQNLFDPPGASEPSTNRLPPYPEPPRSRGLPSPIQVNVLESSWNTVSPSYQALGSYMPSSTMYQNLHLYDQQEAESHNHLSSQQISQNFFDSPFNSSNYSSYH